MPGCTAQRASSSSAIRLHRDEEVGPATRRIEYTDMGIPAIHAKRAAFARVFSGAGKDLAAIQTADRQGLEAAILRSSRHACARRDRGRAQPQDGAQCDRRARRLRSRAEERVGRRRRALRSSGSRRARFADAVAGRTGPSRRRRQCLGHGRRDGIGAARRQRRPAVEALGAVHDVRGEEIGLLGSAHFVNAPDGADRFDRQR